MSYQNNTCCQEGQKNPENCSVINNGLLELDAKCYIGRKREFDRAKMKLDTGEFIQIMAHQGYGKHSFLIRLENYAKNNVGYETVFIDLFKNENIDTSEINKFYKSICKIISTSLEHELLDIESKINKIWTEKNLLTDAKSDKYLEENIINGGEKKIVFFIRGLAKLNSKMQINFYHTLRRWKDRSNWRLHSIVLAYSPDLKSNNNWFKAPSIQLLKFRDYEINDLVDFYRLASSEKQKKQALKIAEGLGFEPYSTNFLFNTFKYHKLYERKFINEKELFKKHFQDNKIENKGLEVTIQKYLKEDSYVQKKYNNHKSGMENFKIKFLLLLKKNFRQVFSKKK